MSTPPTALLLSGAGGPILGAMLAVPAGRLAARALHRRGSCPSTTLVGIPLGVGIWALSPPLAALLLAASVLAWRRMREWSAADPRPVRRRRRLRRGADRGSSMVVGRDERGAEVRIPLGGRSGSHTLVVGATGSGKTVTQSTLAARAIASGMGAVAVDPKGDERLRDALAAAAARSGAAFVEWSPSGPLVYNPLAHGGDTEIVDRALAGERYTEPHYLRLAQRYLGHVVRSLRASGETITLGGLVRHLDPDELEVLGRGLDAERADALHGYLDRLSSAQRRDLAGTRDRLAVLCESDAGRWLEPAAGHGALDLSQCVERGSVVLFRLDADRHPLLAGMLGAAVVQDLVTVAAGRQGDPRPTLVAIDEFSALGGSIVARLFGRGRSAGFSLVLGTQELSDLRGAGGQTLLDQVLGNVGAVVAHRQVVPDSAELLARLAGTRRTWGVAQRVEEGRVRSLQRQRIEEPLVRASELGALNAGEAVVMVPGDPEPVRRTRIAAVA